MALNQIKTTQIKDGEVKRDDLDIATSGQAVTRKLVQGVGIELSSTGVDTGTGDVTVTLEKDNFHFRKTTTESNSTTTFATYLAGTRTVKYTAPYKLTISWVFVRQSISNDAVFDFLINGVSIFSPISLEIKDESNTIPVTLVDVVNLTAGSNTFEFMYRGELGIDPTTVYRAAITLERFD